VDRSYVAKKESTNNTKYTKITKGTEILQDFQLQCL
jgi:hypothetical protein